MIAKIKMSWKMLRYSFGLKMNVGLMILFVVLGIIMEILTRGELFLGAFFIFLVSMWPVQMIYSISMSNEVAASPYKKAMQTSMPALVSAFSEGGAMMLVVILKAIEYLKYPESQGGSVKGLLVICLYALVIAIYTGIAYKFFAASIVLFLVVYMGTYVFLAKLLDMTQPALVPFPAAVVICFVTVILGAAIQYVISILVYKYPLSKRAQGALMSKYL